MPNVVKIELMMDESGAVTGFRSLDTVATKVQTTFKAVGTAGTQMGTQVTQGANAATTALKNTATAAIQAAAAAQSAGAKGGAAMKEIGSHTLTSLDSVRLFRDEFGIHIPRSMEKTMAQSKAVMGVLNSMQGAMIAFGAVGILTALGGEIYKVGQELFRVDDAVQEFNKHLSETAHAKFMDTASIEDMRIQVIGLSGDLKALDSQRGKIGQSVAKRIEDHMYDLNPVGAITSVYKEGKKLSDLDGRRNETQADLDTEDRNGAKKFHEQRLRDIEVESKQAASIENAERRAIRENQVAHDRNSEDARYSVQQGEIERTIANRTRGSNPILHDDTAGQKELAATDAVSDAELATKKIEYAREVDKELRALSREGNNAELRGFQLMEAQKTQAYEDFVRKYGQSEAARAAINKKYNAEEKRASDELTAELARNAREAALAGVTGIAGIEARGRSRDQDITDQLNSGKFSGAGDRTAQEAAANKERATNQLRTHQEMEAEEKRFADTIDSISDASASKQVQGFARINAETKKQLDDLQKKFDEVYGGIADKTSPEYLKGLAELNKGQAAIKSSGNSQAAELARKNADETAKIEAEAYRSALPAMKQHEQEIYDTYNERLRQYQAMLDAQEISQTDFEKRTAAAARELNAQLAADAKAQRDKIASELEPFMGAHPLEALEKFGAKQASEIAAGYVQRISGGGDIAGLDGKGKKSRSLVDLLTPGRKGVHAPGAEAAAAVASMTLTATTVNLYTQGLSLRSGGGGGRGVGASGGGGFTAATASPQIQAAGDSASAALTGGMTGATADGGFGLPSVSAGAADVGAGASGIAGGVTSMTATGGEQALSTTNGVMSAANGIKSIGSQLGIKGEQVQKLTGLSSKTMGTIGGAAGAGAGLFSAFESNGGVGGALSGAMSGAKLGGILGGPVGAAIGAVAGGLMGALGFGGANKAKKYDKDQIRPHIAGTEMAFEMGTMPYQAAYDDLHALEHEAQVTTKQWGPGGVREYDDHIKKEFSVAFDKLTREQKAGRSQYGMNAAQFDSGGMIRGFGDMATSSTNGWIHAKIGETVMHEGATETHGDALAMMLSHATREQMAAYYASTSARGMAPSYRAANQNAAFGGGHQITNNYGHTIHALDAKSVVDLLMDNKHGVRGAYNASYAENSGGSDLG